MSLLSSVNERAPDDFYFALKGSGSGPIATVAGAGIIGTINSGTTSVNHVYPYTFTPGKYYVQLQVEILVNASTAGDVLVISMAQNGVLNADDIVTTFSASGYSSGQVGRFNLSGYITCVSGSGLNFVAGTYGVGSGSSYQIQNPTTSFVYIQKVA